MGADLLRYLELHDRLVVLSDGIAARTARLRPWAAFALTPLIVLSGLYLALAIHYWLPFPQTLRDLAAVVFLVCVVGLWFWAGRTRPVRRIAAGVLIVVVFTAYMAKTPVPQDWVDLQSQKASVVSDGDRVTINNYRDAIHVSGQASIPRWTTQTFDIDQLQTADLVIQPFGNNKALAHILISFGFSDGRHVVVSMEARQAKGGSFDALAGFFRHDELYPELATESDLFWERLSRVPPDGLQIYPILKRPEVLRIYFRRILTFVNQVHDRPIYYSTLSESCMTAFINLAPESFAAVPWYDLRRWIPGYSLALFQQLKLVDDRYSPDDMARRQGVRDNIQSPQDFPSDPAWSVYVRSRLPSHINN